MAKAQTPAATASPAAAAPNPDDNPAGDFSSEAPPGSAEAGPVMSATGGGGGGGPALIKFIDEIDMKAVLSDIEKVKAELSALKEVKFSADTKMKEFAESIGELRNMSSTRDQSFREVEAKVLKSDEIMKALQPQVILTELQKRERELEGTRAQLERTTMMLNETIVQVREIQKSMDRVRGITNILDVDKGLNTKIGRLEELLAAGERFSAKSEKLYYEMDKRMSDFLVLKEKLERVDALTRELLKEFDEKKIKLSSAASTDDITLLKNELTQRMSELREELSKRSAAAPAFSESAQRRMVSLERPFSEEAERMDEAGGPALVASLLKQRDDVKSVLTLLEEEYREGEITEKAFQEARVKNEQRLAELDQQIQSGAVLPTKPVQPISAVAPSEPAPAPAPAPVPGPAAPMPASPSLPPQPVLGPAPIVAVQAPVREGAPSKPSAESRSGAPVEKGSEELEAILEVINNLPSLHAQKRDLERMLSILSRQYKHGVINEESYYEIKAKSEDKLAGLNERLTVMETLPSQVKLFREETKRLKKNKAELVTLLDLLDKQKTDGMLSEDSYRSSKASSSLKLGEIDKRIEMLEKIVEKYASPEMHGKGEKGRKGEKGKKGSEARK